jgi:ribosome biogenesis GTPase
VIEALQNGTIDSKSLDNYMRMLREQDHFQSTVAEKRKKDKVFGKMVKEVLKGKNKEKF